MLSLPLSLDVLLLAAAVALMLVAAGLSIAGRAMRRVGPGLTAVAAVLAVAALLVVVTR